MHMRAHVAVGASGTCPEASEQSTHDLFNFGWS